MYVHFGIYLPNKLVISFRQLEQSVTDINITTFYQLFGVKAFQYFHTVYQNILKRQTEYSAKKKNRNKAARAA